MTRGIANGSRPFGQQESQIELRFLIPALALTLVQLAILLAAWPSAMREMAPVPERVTVPLLPDPSPPPRPIEPNPQADPSPSAPPPPAPNTRLPLPDPPVILPVEMAPPAPLVSPVRSTIVGEATFASPGDGMGNGAGNSAGDGGGGVEAIPPRRFRVSWSPIMRFNRLHDYYPEAARREGIAGRVRLECEVLRRDRVRDCRVLSETPTGHGFGEAALAAQEDYRVRVHTWEGERVYNERFILNARFVPPIE